MLHFFRYLWISVGVYLLRLQGALNWRGGAAELQPPPNQNLKYTDFVDKVISDVLHDLLFSWSKLLKTADVYYIRILKNNVDETERTRFDWT